ncbi:MAG TPA: twin-arginine translocase TatA/TatE family subunit [Candidatus Omnitrophota bacterium]|nr:twin-arginine translocase TatA/TatE family subunit [Candidatus Omnitrophota bacterium]HQO37929.1 twin-arginine translocase TatA/TatE family subunit [Candidatus Omnitrophota bacterium]HQQ06852.1 twin-arginine translocase TatA/TatE family subunit [Candidatus Omnitrophota bacterium]
MFNVGMPELLLVFVVALLVVGPKRLPDLGRQLGKAMASFKRATMDLKEALEQEPPVDIKEEVERKLGYKDETKDRPV